MRVTPVLATLASASTASAAVMHIAATTLSWNWSVTQWGAGCNDTCTYDFDVAAAGNATSKPPRPSFKAHCSGEGEGAGYTFCKNLAKTETPYHVVAQLLPSNDSSHRPQIQVSLEYTDLESNSTWWNFTGKAEASYNQFSAPLLNFTITPDTLAGVA
ncbi:hypothetical protein GGR52DRAFT_111280 [Hypoxylon sp. FL1284]|nr:hypothetical protein GGR52DRAFT_111280 [Hypoxylon sp. FL1284]